MEEGLHSIAVGLLVVYDRDQVIGAERLVDVGIGPTVVTLDSFLDSIFRSQENKDNVTKLWVVLDGLAQRDAVHLGHTDVADDNFRHL